MAVVETERHGEVMLIRMNRPERMNALGRDIRSGLADAFSEFRDSDDLEVAVFTGTGRGFCAGEDMKEALERGKPGLVATPRENPFSDGGLDKVVIGGRIATSGNPDAAPALELMEQQVLPALR